LEHAHLWPAQGVRAADNDGQVVRYERLGRKRTLAFGALDTPVVKWLLCNDDAVKGRLACR